MADLLSDLPGELHDGSNNGRWFVYPQLFPHHSRGSKQADEATVQWGREQSQTRLAVLDQHYIGDSNRHLVGDELTIADFHGASILSLGELIHCGLEGFSNVEAWYDHVTGSDTWTSINSAFQGFADSTKQRDFVGLS